MTVAWMVITLTMFVKDINRDDVALYLKTWNADDDTLNGRNGELQRMYADAKDKNKTENINPSLPGPDLTKLSDDELWSLYWKQSSARYWDLYLKITPKYVWESNYHRIFQQKSVLSLPGGGYYHFHDTAKIEQIADELGSIYYDKNDINVIARDKSLLSHAIKSRTNGRYSAILSLITLILPPILLFVMGAGIIWALRGFRPR